MKSVVKIPNNKSGISPKLLLVAVAAFGVILLIVIGSARSEKGTESFDIDSLDPREYALQVEERVEALCNRIDGVSSCYAVVTLRGGYRAVYASDTQSGGTNIKNQTVIIGSGSSEQGLLLGYENPEIAGIGIVCRGGDDASVKKNVIAVVSSAFNISSNKIFVAGS